MDLNLNIKTKEILKCIDLQNKPNLFLHICCGPCSTSVLDKLNKYFNIYIIFYNPNIDTKEEFNKRLLYLEKVLFVNKYSFPIIYKKYNHNEFITFTTGLENEPEGGLRCEKCIMLRLNYSKDIALNYIKENNLQNHTNYLCTSLSVSPHKNAKLIYDIGCKVCEGKNITYLPSDFKKENGYLKSIVLSKEYGLYRQNYCGCEFSNMHKI